jgi:hypothetical protein
MSDSDIYQIVTKLLISSDRVKETYNLAEAAKLENVNLHSFRKAQASLDEIINKHYDTYEKKESKPG